MPEFVCEKCGKREFHENEDTLPITINVHNQFCRGKENQDHSFMHRDDAHLEPMDPERANDEKDVPILNK